MKTFKAWLSEDAPTNSLGGGEGIRGVGNVTGIPGGDYSNYATNNIADQSKVSSTVQSMVDYHTGMHDDIDGDDDQTTLDSADAKTDQLGSRGRSGRATRGKGTK